MQAGKLRKRVTIEREVNTPDGQGGNTTTWTTVRNAWAQVEPISSGEYFEFQAKNQTITHRGKVRYGVDLRSADRLVDGTRIFVVKAPPRNLGERNRYLEFVAEEVAA